MRIKILNALPESHKLLSVNLHKKKYKGIIWKKEDVIVGDSLLLYKGWPKVHFNSDWYELAVQDVTRPKYTRRDIQFLLRVVSEFGIDPSLIIDVHCGSGRHLLELAKNGFHVVGFEGAELLRRKAIQKAKNSGLKIPFYPTADRFSNPFTGKADVVTTFFNSMGYTFSKKDDIERLSWISDLLKPNGLLLIDYRSAEFQMQKYNVLTKYDDEIRIPASDLTAIAITRKIIDKKILGAVETIYAPVQDRQKVVQRTSYGWELYLKDELRAMLDSCGIQMERAYQSYYSNKLMDGERVFLVGKKDT